MTEFPQYGSASHLPFIAGFPGETEEEFNQNGRILPVISAFDRMGCFAYSAGSKTSPAALMPNQIDEDVKQHRAQIMMEEQMAIMQQLGQQRIGTVGRKYWQKDIGMSTRLLLRQTKAYRFPGY
ncbi:MAG: hypothetical protein ACLTE2_13425 [Eubacteriales bacterium]